jgi:hypothetical protein
VLLRDPAVRLAEPGDAPSVALLLHDFNTEFDEPVPELGDLARHLRGLLEGAAITVLLPEGEGLVVLRFQPSLLSTRVTVVPALPTSEPARTTSARERCTRASASVTEAVMRPVP